MQIKKTLVTKKASFGTSDRFNLHNNHKTILLRHKEYKQVLHSNVFTDKILKRVSAKRF